MKTVMFIFGTRPEAIKMCPLIMELRQRGKIRTLVCVTGQHGQLVDEVLDAFDIVPDYDLAVMREHQTLSGVTEAVLSGMSKVLDDAEPELALVHGDTTTTFAAALACFYAGIPVGHVEAGLRTYDLHSPFPEEFNRQSVDIISTLLFAPTEEAKQRLIREGKDPKRVFVTGNTGIDALKTTVKSDYTHPELEWAAGSKLILITAHRRESLGEPMRDMLRAIRRVIDGHPEVKAIFPMHLNPAVREAAYELLGGSGRIHLTEPLEVVAFHNVLSRCALVLTDSGGIQEEATALGIPTLVLRNTTERPEGVSAGVLRLSGTDEQSVYESFTALLDAPPRCEASGIYGDGHACERIADVLEKELT